MTSSIDSVWTLVAPELPASLPAAVQVGGEDAVIFEYEGRYYAVGRWCPHRNVDLLDGHCLQGSVKCPNHGFMFDLSTGEGITQPQLELAAFEVRVGPAGVFLKKKPRVSNAWR